MAGRLPSAWRAAAAAPCRGGSRGFSARDRARRRSCRSRAGKNEDRSRTRSRREARLRNDFHPERSEQRLELTQLAGIGGGEHELLHARHFTGECRLDCERLSEREIPRPRGRGARTCTVSVETRRRKNAQW